MTKNDFKGRFKYTTLGYFWHLLTPLTQILLYLLIFTVVFGRDIPYYWAYLSTGMFAYNYFMSSSVGSSNIIVNKSSMVTKMALAREMIVFSKVTTNLITLSISYVILAILIAIAGPGLTINVLLLIPIIILYTVFNAGVALMLSSLTVYVRDLSNAVGLLFSCLMFALPIMYLSSSGMASTMRIFWDICPLYYFIEVIHDVFYFGVCPNNFELCICILSSVLIFTIGLYVFKKLEHGFAERL